MWFRYSLRKMIELFANSGDTDQMPHFVASDQGLHYLPITLSGISSLQRVKLTSFVKKIMKIGWDLRKLLSFEDAENGCHGSLHFGELVTT